jgi:hypothetical protein
VAIDHDADLVKSKTATVVDPQVSVAEEENSESLETP